MQLPYPYFRVSDRMPALIDHPSQTPAEGPVAETVFGYHTLWIAEVPFLVNNNPKDFAYEAEKRLTYVLKRQRRFLYDLAQSCNYQATFELRFVSWPQAHGQSQVGIAFLGKTFHEDSQASLYQARTLWEKFSAVFPREAPFSYPLIPVSYELEQTSQQTHSFLQWFQPIDFEQLTALESIVELRKYEDWPDIRNIRPGLQGHDYFPHPFEPALDYSALGRLFETLACQRRIAIVSITLRPQRLMDQEIASLHELLSWYQQAAEGDMNMNSPLLEVLPKTNMDIWLSLIRTRAAMGKRVYETLVRERNNLFLGRIQVIGFPSAQRDLLETLGSEMTADVESLYPSRWTAENPRTFEDLRWARFNTQWLEFVRWGTTPRVVENANMFVRLRQYMTVGEAMGAFRLPISSNDGLAGIEVRNEPFSLPHTVNKLSTSFPFGTLKDRGIQTDIAFSLPQTVFSEGIALLGENGEARSRILHQLLQIASSSGIPWIFIRSQKHAQDTSSYNLPAQTIAVETAGNPLPIQLFSPPPGISLVLFLDALQRVLTVVCYLEPAEAIVLRKILVRVYKNTDWLEQPGIDQNGATELAQRFERVLGEIQAPAEAISKIGTRVLLPLQDLALTASTLFTTPASPPTKTALLETMPLIIEIGWLGSDISRAIVNGCLWAWFTLAFSTQKPAQGIVVQEDAHTLFSSQSGLSPLSVTPTSSLAHTYASQGIGGIILDDRPDLLDDDIFRKIGVCIVTHNGNVLAQEKAARLLNATPGQASRMLFLRNQEAVVAVPGTPPTLITV